MSTSVDKCVNCGMCKALCPVLLAEKNEGASPRGRVIMIREKVNTELMFKCSLCNACKDLCPVEINIPDEIRKARSKMETENNKKMIENVRKHGNPFGKPGEKVETLYCC